MWSFNKMDAFLYWTLVMDDHVALVHAQVVDTHLRGCGAAVEAGVPSPAAVRGT